MRLHHLAFRTGDVDRLVGFYADVFGLRVARDGRPRSVWLELDEAVLMVEARAAGEPTPPPGSLELVAFAVDADAKARVRARAEALGCYDGETAHTVYLRDPDGRRVGASTYPLTGAPGPVSAQ